MMDASPDYIEQVLSAIDEQFGSIDAYLQEKGISKEAIASLRANFLEDDVVSIHGVGQDPR